MPLFDFRCRECGYEFETLVTGAKAPECRRCGSAELEKLASTFATRSSGQRATGSIPRPRFT